jgi:hypothetical protein
MNVFDSWFGRRVKAYCNWIKYDPKGLPTALGLILMGLNIVEERIWEALFCFIDWWNIPQTKGKGK